MGENNEDEDEFKIITLGEMAVGKTSIIKRYVYEDFSLNELSTMGVENSFKEIEVNGKKIKFNLIDTSGQEKFKAIAANYFRYADIVLFVFDWSNKKTFENMKEWINYFNENNDGKNIIKKYLIGNKNDLEKNVEQNLIDEFAKENNLTFMSTSAKYKDKIEELFLLIGYDVYDYLENQKGNDKNKNKKQVIRNLNKKKRSKKCC